MTWLLNTPVACQCISWTDLPAQTIVGAATLRQKMQIKLSILPSQSILTPGQPVTMLTLQRKKPGSPRNGKSSNMADRHVEMVLSISLSHHRLYRSSYSYPPPTPTPVSPASPQSQPPPLRHHNHDHDHESLNPSRGHGCAVLLNAAPAVSTSDGHGQELGSWQSSSLSPPLTVMGKSLGRGKALPCLHL